MKRDWTKFKPMAVVSSTVKKDGTNIGRSCCGGSCIGGNCKATENISKIFK